VIARFAGAVTIALASLLGHSGAGRLSAQETDLTPALTGPAVWDSSALTEGWARTRAEGTRIFRTRADTCHLLGRRAMSVTGCFQNGTLTSFTAVLLDSGAWFGYVPDDQAKAAEASRGAEFTRLFRDVSTDAPLQLGRVFASRTDLTLGTTAWLKRKVAIVRTGQIAARLTIIPDQLVKISVFRNGENATELIDGRGHGSDRTSDIREFASRVRDESNGDRVINGVPVFPQGDRAYCGVSTLASVMSFCGLTLDTEDYAAAAGIRFGSTRKSHIREVYDAAGKEAALHMFHSTKFEWNRAQQSIDAGFPVIVFRRWNQERDYLHTAFARRFATDATIELPRADANDQKSWPTRDAYAHASVINGYNAKRREIIFTESWSEMTRNRRMRVEEIEATTYLAYYPRL
jgi:hypothetical protein